MADQEGETTEQADPPTTISAIPMNGFAPPVQSALAMTIDLRPLNIVTGKSGDWKESAMRSSIIVRNRAHTVLDQDAVPSDGHVLLVLTHVHLAEG